MRMIGFAVCVVLAASLSAQGQEKRPKMTLLHSDNPSQYYDYYYGPELINIPEMRTGSVGKMPSGWAFTFHRIYRKRCGFPQVQQTYVVVNGRCPCETLRQFLIKITDTDKRFAKCEPGDRLVFEGKFRVVVDRNLEPGGTGVFVVGGADNNATVFPVKNRLGVPKQK